MSFSIAIAQVSRVDSSTRGERCVLCCVTGWISGEDVDGGGRCGTYFWLFFFTFFVFTPHDDGRHVAGGGDAQLRRTREINAGSGFISSGEISPLHAAV